MDSLNPGSVVELKRTIWALGKIQIFDGDGSLFATQGVFRDIESGDALVAATEAAPCRAS
jgi:hypothetical protein